MVQSAKDRIRDDVSVSLDRTSAGRVLLERNLRPHLIVIVGVFRKDAPKMLGIEHDQMIRALVPDRADQTFYVAVLPRRAVRRGPVADPHGSHTTLKCNAKCSVIIANKIFQGAVPGKRFGDLTCQPLGCRVAGHRKPQQQQPLVPENHKCEQLLKRNRRDPICAMSRATVCRSRRPASGRSETVQ
jgi:hypothetical protein